MFSVNPFFAPIWRKYIRALYSGVFQSYNMAHLIFNSCLPSPSRVDYAKAHLRQCQQHCTGWNRCTDYLFGSSRGTGWLHPSPKCTQAEYKYLHSTLANKSCIYDHSSPCSLQSDLVRFVQRSLSCVFHLCKCQWSQWWCIIELLLLLLLLVNKWIRSCFGCVAAAAAALCRSRSSRSKESWNVVVTTYLQFSPTKNWDIWQPLTIWDVQGELFGRFRRKLRSETEQMFEQGDLFFSMRRTELDLWTAYTASSQLSVTDYRSVHTKPPAGMILRVSTLVGGSARDILELPVARAPSATLPFLSPCNGQPGRTAYHYTHSRPTITMFAPPLNSLLSARATCNFFAFIETFALFIRAFINWGLLDIASWLFGSNIVIWTNRFSLKSKGICNDLWKVLGRNKSGAQQKDYWARWRGAAAALFQLISVNPTDPNPTPPSHAFNTLPHKCTALTPNFTCHGCWLQQLREILRDRGADRNVLGWEETRARLSKTHCASHFCHPCTPNHPLSTLPPRAPPLPRTTWSQIIEYLQWKAILSSELHTTRSLKGLTLIYQCDNWTYFKRYPNRLQNVWFSKGYSDLPKV